MHGYGATDQCLSFRKIALFYFAIPKFISIYIFYYFIYSFLRRSLVEQPGFPNHGVIHEE